MVAGYRNIWSFHNGDIPKDERGRSYHIHHLDGNRRNNYPHPEAYLSYNLKRKYPKYTSCYLGTCKTCKGAHKTSKRLSELADKRYINY